MTRRAILLALLAVLPARCDNPTPIYDPPCAFTATSCNDQPVVHELDGTTPPEPLIVY